MVQDMLPASYKADDAMGNLTSMTLGATSRTFTYQTPTPKLSTVTETGIGTRIVGYDSAGNESVQGGTYSYSPRNLLATVAGSTGALIRARLGHAPIHQTPTDPTTVYTYDGRGIRVKLSQTSGSTTKERSFLYDDAMRLIAETTYQTPPSTAIQYEYVWFGGQPVAQETIGGSTAWTVTDHLGTPFLQTNSSGTVIWRVEYEPYGEVFSLRSGSDRHRPLRLPGQEAEQLDFGINGDFERSYNIFRWYRPKWGRYTQADPVGLEAGTHLFGYASQTPLMLTDPTGLRTLGLGGTVVNLSDCCVLASDNDNVPGGNGQRQKWIPPKSWSGTEDVDAIYFRDGSALKIPDWSIYVIYDCNSPGTPPSGLASRCLGTCRRRLTRSIGQNLFPIETARSARSTAQSDRPHRIAGANEEYSLTTLGAGGGRVSRHDKSDRGVVWGGGGDDSSRSS